MNYKNISKILLLLVVILVSTSAISAGLFGWGTDSNALKGDGQYKVGTDIPAGEYYIKCTGSNLYVEVAKDSSGELNSIITNLNTEGGTYITVEEGQYLTIQGGELYELDKMPDIKPSDGVYKSGMYKVGTDIPAGEYTVEATMDLAYIEIASDSSRKLGSIVTNDNFDGTKIITISDGQYLILDNGAEIRT